MMDVLEKLHQEAVELHSQIANECITVERSQSHRQKIEVLQLRAEASIAELQQKQSDTPSDQAALIAKIYELIKQSLEMIDQLIESHVAKGKGGIETIVPPMTAQEPSALKKAESASSAIPNMPGGSNLGEATSVKREQLPLNSKLFQLQPIENSNEQIDAHVAIINKILTTLNNMAIGNVSCPKPTSLDDPQVGGPVEDIRSIINEISAQAKDTEQMSKNVEAIEKALVENRKTDQHPCVELKLDKIQLPTFDGDLTTWIAFRDQYLDLVHNNQKLTAVTKFYQLKNHLKGLALDAINGFKLSAADYEAAWFVLMKRYDKPDQIIDEYIRKFETLPYLTNAHAVGLIRMVNAANQLIRVLPNLGVDVTTWDKWIIFNLKAKLDKGTLHKWMDQVKLRQNIKLQELLEFLEVEAAECLPTEAERTRPYEISKNSQKRFRKMKPATTMVVTVAKCKQCNGDHPIYRCPTFKALPVADRIKKVKAAKLCIRCLQEHQHPADCKFGACPTCTKDHNSLLCFKKEQPKKESENSDSAIVA